jgi:hypothetical protein
LPAQMTRSGRRSMASTIPSTNRRAPSPRRSRA